MHARGDIRTAGAGHASVGAELLQTIGGGLESVTLGADLRSLANENSAAGNQRQKADVDQNDCEQYLDEREASPASRPNE